MAKYDEFGRELPDPTPLSIPSGFRKPLSIHEQIKRFVREELSQVAEDHKAESFEEADDFDVEDEDPDPLSPYEIPEGAPERVLAGEIVKPESLDGSDDGKEPKEAKKPAPEDLPDDEKLVGTDPSESVTLTKHKKGGPNSVGGPKKP